LILRGLFFLLLERHLNFLGAGVALTKARALVEHYQVLSRFPHGRWLQHHFFRVTALLPNAEEAAGRGGAGRDSSCSSDNAGRTGTQGGVRSAGGLASVVSGFG
jgi:hypothetical protein